MKYADQHIQSHLQDRAAFNENRKAAAAYIMRERAIGFCWSYEHLRGRGFIEDSIKSVQVEDI